MTNEEFDRIIDRYMADQATNEEKRLIESFFESQERRQPKPDKETSAELWRNIEEAIQEPVPASSSSLRRATAAIACSLIVITILGYFGYHRYKNDKEELITKTAANGERSIVTLTDGTKVYLNSGSAITFPKVFNNSLREVALTGEAFFEVTKNAQQPFIVRTGDLVTRVLGTSFNIQAFESDDISVTVATGRVQVSQESALAGSSQQRSPQTILLDPSQRVSYHNHRFTLSYVDIDKAIAWKDNTIRFDETPLSAVARTLERWYDVNITFDNNDIVNCRINGQFKGQQLHEVLRSIRYMYNIDYEIINPNKIILYGKGCKK